MPKDCAGVKKETSGGNHFSICWELCHQMKSGKDPYPVLYSLFSLFGYLVVFFSKEEKENLTFES